MAARNAIKRRRKEKIRALREEMLMRPNPDGTILDEPKRNGLPPHAGMHPQRITSGAPSMGGDPQHFGSFPGQTGERPPLPPPPYPESFANDPEAVWKEKQKYWERQYREAQSREAIWSGLWSVTLFKYKLVISILLLVLVWGLFALDHPRTEAAQRFVEQALTQSIDFQAAEAWYYRHFDGFPAFIPAFRGNEPAEKVSARQPESSYFQPAQGKIVTPFSEQHPGVLLETEPRAPVFSLDAGRVLFAGHTDETGWTVIVQHGGGVTAYYGLLQDVQRNRNDWVKGGDLLGYASGDEQLAYGQVYLAIKREDRFVDPSSALKRP